MKGRKSLFEAMSFSSSANMPMSDVITRNINEIRLCQGERLQVILFIEVYAYMWIFTAFISGSHGLYERLWKSRYDRWCWWNGWTGSHLHLKSAWNVITNHLHLFLSLFSLSCSAGPSFVFLFIRSLSQASQMISTPMALYPLEILFCSPPLLRTLNSSQTQFQWIPRSRRISAGYCVPITFAPRCLFLIFDHLLLLEERKWLRVDF